MADIGAHEYGGESPGANVNAIRVNCGGAEFVTGGAETFDPDYGFNAGVAASVTGDVLNTTDDGLYLAFRRLPVGTATLVYRFDDNNTPPANGDGTVTLYFAESFWGDNRRAFHIDVQGTRVETDFRPYDEAGGTLTAITKTYPASVTDNVLTVSFSHGSGTDTGTGVDTKPEIMAIKWVLDAPVSDPLGAETLPIRIASGTANGGTYFGNTFEDDRNYTAGALVTSTADPIAGTTEDALYQKGRRSENNNEVLEYTFTIPTTTVDVILHFSEIFFTANGNRVFDILINGNLKLNNYDIHADVGADTATTKTYQITTANQADNLVITLDSRTANGGVDKATIAGLEIVAATAAPTIAPPNPSETADSATQITATHDPVTGATSYDYEIRLLNDTLVSSGSEATPGRIFTGLSEYTAYKWRSRATNSGGDGPWGDYREITTLDETNPTTGTIGSVTVVGNVHTINLSTAPTDAHSGMFGIEVFEGDDLITDFLTGETLQITFAQDFGATRNWKIRGVDNAGNEGLFSNVVQTTGKISPTVLHRLIRR